MKLLRALQQLTQDKKAKMKSPFDVLEYIAKERLGFRNFDSLDLDLATALIDMKKADALAVQMHLPEKTFWANNVRDIKLLVNAHPEVLKGEAAEIFKTL